MTVELTYTRRPQEWPWPVDDLLRQGKNVRRRNGEILCNVLVPAIVKPYDERDIVDWPEDLPDV